MKKTVAINPFNRVEGDLEIKVDIKDGQVANAHASGVMFRGFEKLLRGRDPMDALVFTCRICGICSLSHSTASSNALRSAFQAHMPPNAYFVRNIVLGTEIAINHPTHFYALFNIDLINEKYQNHPGYEELVRRFAPFKGSSYIRALRARRNFLGFLGLFAGKWPNSLVLQPGGTTRTVNRSEIVRATGILSEFRAFVAGTNCPTAVAGSKVGTLITALDPSTKRGFLNTSNTPGLMVMRAENIHSKGLQNPILTNPMPTDVQ